MPAFFLNNPIILYMSFPPKIIARVGTTIIETPGTPTFDIPTKGPQKANKIHCIIEKSNSNIV